MCARLLAHMHYKAKGLGAHAIVRIVNLRSAWSICRACLFKTKGHRRGNAPRDAANHHCGSNATTLSACSAHQL